MNRTLLIVTWLVACGAEPSAAPPAAGPSAPAPAPALPATRALPAATAPEALGGGEIPAEPRAQPTATAAPELSEMQRAALARAKSRAQAFGKTLKSTLKAAMEERGVAGAFEVCAAEAQKLTAEAQGDDVALGRSSLRLRNADNRAPDWVQAQLDAWGERRAEGLAPVVVPADTDVRLIIALPVDGLCLNCHGPADALQPAVRQLILKRYPQDQATGYHEGDLRGALWAIARTEG